MKFLYCLAVFAAVASIVALVASFSVESSFRSRAKLVQLVKPSNEAALFGEIGEMIGSPKILIVDDDKAFLNQKTDAGAELVDSTYLESRGIYPLQLKTVTYLAGAVRLGSGLVFIVAVASAWWLRRVLRHRLSARQTAIGTTA